MSDAPRPDGRPELARAILDANGAKLCVIVFADRSVGWCIHGLFDYWVPGDAGRPSGIVWSHGRLVASGPHLQARQLFQAAMRVVGLGSLGTVEAELRIAGAPVDDPPAPEIPVSWDT